ncbi:hypothetical protein NSK_008713 [Nannochloropsis salina CCMP1776]|uniref:Uncharacterized protein n=1 Tax=Nannochloropsis salina CCMP1776 TaxID=1027361 RepID=A0A4D9CN16_9STRA|nr:hypothetical protein NSK_008713 [Nannochloropsis salina CCMP1776]|eukprot:TFJ80156.1 hypothetical protein NSK_008713 [Nannochloropsis salina CCMP1776]
MRLHTCFFLLNAISGFQAYARQTTKCDTTEAERAEVMRRTLESLENEYEILPGSLSFPPFAQPAGRYGLVAFDGKVVNPPALCEITSRVDTPYGPGLCNYSFVLGPRDAVVGLFCTPPPVKYFSLRSYTGFRFLPQAWLPAAELADPDNNLTFNTTAKVPRRSPYLQGKREGSSESDAAPFCRTAAFVSTGDGVTARDVRRALAGAGWAATATNLDVVSAEKAYFRDVRRPWAIDRSDAFVINYRVSQPIDSAAVAPYFASSYPFYMLRHRPEASSATSATSNRELGNASGAPAQATRPTSGSENMAPGGNLGPLPDIEDENAPREPLTTPPLRPRGTGQDEAYLLPTLARLEEAVTAYMGRSRGAVLHARWEMEHILPDTQRCLTEPDYFPIAASVPEWNLTGFATCGFFSRDCLYTFLSLPTTGKVDYGDLTFPRNRSFVFLGANQVGLEKVTYSNIFMTATAEPQKQGRTVNFSAQALEGSANWFLPEDPAAKDLFAVTLTRDDCRQGVLGRDGRRGGALSTDEAFCTTVSEGVLSYEEFVYIVERKYLEPATQIGPDPDEVLPPVVLVFESPDITSLGFEKETERMEAMARF